MKTRCLFLLGLLGLAVSAGAQFGVKPETLPIKGSFYVSVDDEATIYVNGRQTHRATLNETRSAEAVLQVGDRVVVHLKNTTAGRRFLMCFASGDGGLVVSFRNQDLKIVPDLGVKDFTPEQLAKWTKSAEQAKRRDDKLPIKSYSEWMWGDLDQSILAGTVTPAMITQRPK